MGQNGQIPQAPQQRGSSELHSLCFTHTPCPLSVSPQHCRGARGLQQEPAVSGMGHGANARFYSRGSSVSSHQAQPTLAPSLMSGEQRVGQGTQGSHTRAALLSRTIPAVEQFRISPFHQHQVIQFHFCTSWVYLARREPSSLLSICLVAQSVTSDPSLPLPKLLLSPSLMWSRATRQVLCPTSHAAVLEQGLLAIRPPSWWAVGVGLGPCTVLLVAA